MYGEYNKIIIIINVLQTKNEQTFYKHSFTLLTSLALYLKHTITHKLPDTEDDNDDTTTIMTYGGGGSGSGSTKLFVFRFILFFFFCLFCIFLKVCLILEFLNSAHGGSVE